MLKYIHNRDKLLSSVKKNWLGVLNNNTKMSRYDSETACGSSSKYQEDRSNSSTRLQDQPRTRHPPWLKGKEIGLFYRDLGKNKRKEQKEKHKETKTAMIKLDHNIEEKLRAVIMESDLAQFASDDVWNNPNWTNPTNNEFEKKYTHINDSQFKRKFIEIVSGNIQDNLAKAMRTESGLRRDEKLDDHLSTELRSKGSHYDYKTMLKFRSKLPAYERRKEVLDIINENQVIVISGETGCGKTTQVPQFILDDQIASGNGSVTKIVCTQPRRISAISVAERVADERAERLGNSVGYHIRLEKVLPRDYGSIIYCTSGMLLQYMQSDPALKQFSHVILDEIHERTTESDFILTLLKQVIPKRPDLKIVLMSATLNSESFSKYYNYCPMIHIPGFTYPVKEYYLEDVLLFTGFRFEELPEKQKKRKTERKKQESLQMIAPHIRRLQVTKQYPMSVINQLWNPNSETLNLELVEQLVWYICNREGPGAILIFLPGMMDISKLNKMMSESARYPQNRFNIYPLHSRMPTVEQKLIFREPPEGVRKIIIATSIAETSITIEDVVYVIDCGQTKLNRFDVERNIQTLQAEWVTLANAKQRRGRAGRVREGVCYHLYSKAREMVLEQYPVPEMLRTRLEEVILQIKILQLGKAKSFLSKVMDPPNGRAIDLSLSLLRQLKALDDDEHLTPLGYHLAQLPLDPRTGKMIIWAALFSCVEPVFAIAASLTFKDAFYCPLGKEQIAMQKKKELGLNEYSDHIALAEALRRFENAYRTGSAGRFCHEYFLSMNTLKLLSDMKQQFARHLYQMKFLNDDNPRGRDANRNSNNIALIKAIVCAALYPNIATIKRVFKHGAILSTPEDGRVSLHPSSVNDKITGFPSPYLIYFTKQKSTAIFLHDTTCVTASILLFADPHNYIKREKGKYVISFNNSQKLLCDPQTAETIMKLQDELIKILEYKITHPGTVQWDTREGRVLNAIIELISQKDEQMGFNEVASGNTESNLPNNNT